MFMKKWFKAQDKTKGKYGMKARGKCLEETRHLISTRVSPDMIILSFNLCQDSLHSSPFLLRQKSFSDLQCTDTTFLSEDSSEQQCYILRAFSIVTSIAAHSLLNAFGSLRFAGFLLDANRHDLLLFFLENTETNFHQNRIQPYNDSRDVINVLAKERFEWNLPENDKNISRIWGYPDT